MRRVGPWKRPCTLQDKAGSHCQRATDDCNVSCQDKYRLWRGGLEALKARHASTEFNTKVTTKRHLGLAA